MAEKFFSKDINSHFHVEIWDYVTSHEIEIYTRSKPGSKVLHYQNKIETRGLSRDETINHLNWMVESGDIYLDIPF